MIGKIIINPFLHPKETVKQADRLKEEFVKLGVDVEIVSNGFLNTYLSENNLITNLKNVDFAIYLDKDKYLSCELEKCGIKLFNSHESIRICDDKAETYIALSNNGLNIPDTIFAPLCYDKTLNLEDYSDRVIEKLSLPLIVKESYGSMGKGVYLAKTKQELIDLCEKLKTKPHLFQRYLPYKKGTDIRVIVIGGKVVSAMMRKNDKDFRSNIALGGVGTSYELNEEFKNTAEKVARLLKLDYCGVDLLFGEKDKPYVCEVNSNAFFNEMERVSGKNIAKIYAEYIINSL